MATTLRADSFSDINIKERSTLSAVANAGATSITMQSTAGFAADDYIVVGPNGLEGAELRVVDTVSSGTALTLTAALTQSHAAHEPVTALVGGKVRIYRAANVDDTAPDAGDFLELADRTIEVDSQSTYYIDSAGSSDYWYRLTYVNDITFDETDIEDSEPFRGNDFGHYASISAIRAEAGFDNATNLKDSQVDEQRRAAQAMINTRLSDRYTTPFTDPVPELIRTITIKLAAAFLLRIAYGGGNLEADAKVKEVEAVLKSLADGSVTLGDDAVTLADVGVSSYFGEEDRLFTIGDIY